MSTAATAVMPLRRKGQRIDNETVQKWVQMRIDGVRLQKIADLYNTTPQYVIALTKSSEHAGDFVGAIGVATPMTEQDKQELADRVNVWLADQVTATIAEVMDEFGITKHQWSLIREQVDQTHIIGRARQGSRATTYTDKLIQRSLRRALKASGRQWLTGVVYEAYRDRDNDPSVPTINNRYGSWRRACQKLDIPDGGRGRTEVTWSTWQDEQLLEWVRKFRDQLDVSTRPSFARYDTWQRTQKGAPSGSLVRVRLKHLGNWADIMRVAIDGTPALPANDTATE
jgi:hypothetical protein